MIEFTQNKNTEDLFKAVQNMANRKPIVFAFDEIDKVEDFDFLYSILNDIYKKSIFLITNYKEWLDKLEDRIKSRLLPEIIEFKSYDERETSEILKQRTMYAFLPGVLDDAAFNLISKTSTERGDIRAGLYLLREAGRVAESLSSKKISEEHARKAITKLEDFNIKKSTDLDEDTRLVLGIYLKCIRRKAELVRIRLFREGLRS